MQMGRGNCLSEKQSTRTYHFRSCKRMRLTNMELLSDDLVFNILVFLPAQDIYNSARLVCRKWYSMTRSRSFIKAHFKNTTHGHGLLIQDGFPWTGKQSIGPFFMAMRQSRIEVSKLNRRMKCIWTSCNGLILERHDEVLTVYIANPATNQRFLLPRLPRYLSASIPGIAYAKASMEYKVAVMFDDYSEKRLKFRCMILTVGVDNSWGYVATKHLEYPPIGIVCGVYPLITEGYIHWGKGGRVTSLNVETEIITMTNLPPEVEKHKDVQYLSTGRGSSLVSVLHTRGKYLWEVWEMEPATKEWTKLPDINMEGQKRTLNRWLDRYVDKSDHTIRPVGWLKYPEVLVLSSFEGSRACVAYNVATQEVNLFVLASNAKRFRFSSHRNTLMWLD